MNDVAAFARLIEALRPWLPRVVVVGGWAHRLHRLHPAADPPTHMPIVTRDVDLALCPTPPLEGDIGAALRAADFHLELTGDCEPPVAEYRLRDDSQAFYAEFLTPLRGRGDLRGGSPDATLAMAGVTAQKLRYLDVLLVDPWGVRLGEGVGYPLARPADVLVPNPTCFIAQRMLIRNSRHPSKWAQDALYIHDTLELFGSHLQELRAIWLEHVKPGLSPRALRTLDRVRLGQFGSMTDVLRDAAAIPQDRQLTAKDLQALCELGLELVFDGP